MKAPNYKTCTWEEWQQWRVHRHINERSVMALFGHTKDGLMAARERKQNGFTGSGYEEQPLTLEPWTLRKLAKKELFVFGNRVAVRDYLLKR